ncbi:MAG: DUF814 domain-containing protein, partial [Cyanobacteria bacterium REEB65]|nr:DUF814 domain-containing protein [Cyanobacteria bacterium REEB65]
LPRLQESSDWDYTLLPIGRDEVPIVRAGQTAGSLVGAPVSALLDSYYGRQLDGLELEARRSLLLRMAGDRLAKLERLAAAATTERIDEAVRQRCWGDLLLAHSGVVPPGVDRVDLPDFASGHSITIPLDPSLSAIENAQRHYRSAKKAQGAAKAAEQHKVRADRECEQWQRVRSLLLAAETLADLERAAAPLVQAKSAARSPQGGGPGRYRSADGFEILVGRNNRQNDQITWQIARPDDWWFHAQRVPGAHVVVRGAPDNRPLPERTCLEAANLAAWFSRGRADSRVAVAYTRRKHVHKPAGAKPGLAVYDHERIVVVQPQEVEMPPL